MSVYQDASQNGSTTRGEHRRMKREAAKMSFSELKSQTSDAMAKLSVELVLEHIEEEMDLEADRLAGAAKGKHCKNRTGKRHGYTSGYVVMHGRKIEIDRPRVRSLDNKTEFELASYRWAREHTALDMTALLLLHEGISTRAYKSTVDTVASIPDYIRTSGMSRSAVSRRFVKKASQVVDEIMSRPLNDTRYLAVFVDGTQEGDHHVLVALGLTEHGEKRIIGLSEGSSENASVAGELLANLETRGLQTDGGLLMVIDGAKALAAAITKTFGDEVLIQRCQVHKMRNVLEKLPENKQAQVERMIAKAYRADSYSQAKTSLEILADKLQLEGYQSAASSLREGMSETLTVLKLGVDPGLCKTLSNTNPIESAFSVYAACSKHVKRWRNGRQALNWIGMGLLKAEDGFQRIANPDGLEKLADVLTRHAQSGVPAYQSKAASAA
jgi:putative transposase